MNIRMNSISCQQAKELDMVAYLASLGHTPARVRNSDYWYHSPLREERTPSFKINRKLNRWYDHGLGKGGNLIDFALLYHGCDVRELLQELSRGASLQPSALQRQHVLEKESGAGKLMIVLHQSLSSPYLCRYLSKRGISQAVAARYCREVTYHLYCKQYRAIGFRNDAGGYELRTPSFKASSSPKCITTLNQGAREVVVLEGFMDFLSYRELHKDRKEDQPNFVILNSLAFFEKARPFLEQHEVIRLHLDNDTAGRHSTHYALSLSSRYRDESGLYRHRKDLNEWLMHQGKTRLKILRQRPR